jgi:hypothetical protein
MRFQSNYLSPADSTEKGFYPSWWEGWRDRVMVLLTIPEKEARKLFPKKSLPKIPHLVRNTSSALSRSWGWAEVDSSQCFPAAVTAKIIAKVFRLLHYSLIKWKQHWNLILYSVPLPHLSTPCWLALSEIYSILEIQVFLDLCRVCDQQDSISW